MSDPDTYGTRPMPQLYAEINQLRAAIRAQGTPDIQDAWDRVEEHIDIAYRPRDAASLAGAEGPTCQHLNFKAQFAKAVEYGHKRQTVRAPRKDGRPHCKVGDKLQLYTGMRTKGCRLLGHATVTRIATVRIEATCMKLNGNHVPSILYDRDGPQTDNEFAEADGFDSFMDMADWFDTVHGLPFEGVVIYWTEPR